MQAWKPATSPYGKDTALGKDQMSALGALMGDQVGKNFGFGGLGLKGAKPATTGTAAPSAPQEAPPTTGALTTPAYGKGAGGFHGRSAKPPVAAKASTAPPRSRDEIKKTLLGEYEGVKRCYEQQLDRHAGLEGQIVVRFLIDAEGAPQEVNVGENTTGDPVLAGCVARVVKSVGFGPGAPARVQYPYAFSTGPGGAQDWMPAFTQGIELGLKILPLLL